MVVRLSSVLSTSH